MTTSFGNWKGKRTCLFQLVRYAVLVKSGVPRFCFFSLILRMLFQIFMSQYKHTQEQVNTHTLENIYISLKSLCLSDSNPKCLCLKSKVCCFHCDLTVSLHPRSQPHTVIIKEFLHLSMAPHEGSKQASLPGPLCSGISTSCLSGPLCVFSRLSIFHVPIQNCALIIASLSASQRWDGGGLHWQLFTFTISSQPTHPTCTEPPPTLNEKCDSLYWTHKDFVWTWLGLEHCGFEAGQKVSWLTVSNIHPTKRLVYTSMIICNSTWVPVSFPTTLISSCLAQHSPPLWRPWLCTNFASLYNVWRRPQPWTNTSAGYICP